MYFVRDIEFDTVIPFEEQLVGFSKYLKDFGDSTAPTYCVADSKDLSKVYYPLVSGVDLLGFFVFDFAEHLTIYTKEFWRALASTNFTQDVYVLLEDVLMRYYSWAEVGKKPVCFDVVLSNNKDWITCRNINKVSRDWTIKATKYTITGKSTCSMIEPYIHSFLTTTKAAVTVKSSRFIDSFPVLFFQVYVRLNEEPLKIYHLAFRVTNNDICYLDVFEKDFKTISELFGFNKQYIKEVF